jgi:hypothetical protein
MKKHFAASATRSNRLFDADARVLCSVACTPFRARRTIEWVRIVAGSRNLLAMVISANYPSCN